MFGFLLPKKYEEPPGIIPMPKVISEGHKHKMIFMEVAMERDTLWMKFLCIKCDSLHLVDREFWKLLVTGQAELL